MFPVALKEEIICGFCHTLYKRATKLVDHEILIYIYTEYTTQLWMQSWQMLRVKLLYAVESWGVRMIWLHLYQSNRYLRRILPFKETNPTAICWEDCWTHLSHPKKTHLQLWYLRHKIYSWIYIIPNLYQKNPQKTLSRLEPFSREKYLIINA